MSISSIKPNLALCDPSSLGFFKDFALDWVIKFIKYIDKPATTCSVNKTFHLLTREAYYPTIEMIRTLYLYPFSSCTLEKIQSAEVISLSKSFVNPTGVNIVELDNQEVILFAYATDSIKIWNISDGFDKDKFLNLELPEFKDLKSCTITTKGECYFCTSEHYGYLPSFNNFKEGIFLSSKMREEEAQYLKREFHKAALNLIPFENGTFLVVYEGGLILKFNCKEEKVEQIGAWNPSEIVTMWRKVEKRRKNYQYYGSKHWGSAEKLLNEPSVGCDKARYWNQAIYLNTGGAFYKVNLNDKSFQYFYLKEIEDIRWFTFHQDYLVASAADKDELFIYDMKGKEPNLVAEIDIGVDAEYFIFRDNNFFAEKQSSLYNFNLSSNFADITNDPPLDDQVWEVEVSPINVLKPGDSVSSLAIHGNKIYLGLLSGEIQIMNFEI